MVPGCESKLKSIPNYVVICPMEFENEYKKGFF